MALPIIQLKNDKQITISVGASRKSLKWVNTELLWSEFVARLSVPQRTSETMAEYQHMAKAKRDAIKDNGGFVGGALKSGRRKAENVEYRSVITLDLDSIPMGVNVWTIVELVLNCAVAMYSTHSHTETANRLRLVIPLSRNVSADEYGAISRKIAEDIGIDYCDDTTYEAHRLMYWASCPIDADYVFEYSDGEILDVDEVLGRYTDWTDISTWPRSSRQAEQSFAGTGRQKNPLEKEGIIGAFCQVYDIPRAIDKYLSDVYLPSPMADRYSYANGSTTGGLVLYEDGNFAFSHHSTDPCSGKLVNAFDLVRLHKFSEFDDDVPEDTVISKKPSYTAMINLAVADEDVSYQLALNRVDAFDDVDVDDADGSEGHEEEIDTSWLKELEMTGKGTIASTIENAKIILLNDPRLKDSFYYDDFRERPIVCGNLPWVKLRDRASNVWFDADDAGLRSFLENRYKLDSAVKIRDAVELAMLVRSRHPVREYLTELEWDGEERMERLFIDYLGAEDSEYTKAVTKAALIGAVARILEPGCKHDHMLVLVGPQGCRKSTTLAKLGREWFSDSLFTLSGKEAYEQIQGYWIIEMGEMAAAKKSEIEQIKQFISKQVDSYRSAYARRTQEHPRQCAFFGSTNDVEFLRDYTGARRFWPVVVNDTGKKMAERLNKELVDQIWAEAVCCYRLGDRWYLTADVEDLAREVQEKHTEVSAIEGVVLGFIEKQVPKDWDQYSLDQRRMFWGGAFDSDEQMELVDRSKICAMEVWCEALGGDVKSYTRMTSREINNTLKKMPGWTKVSSIRTCEDYGLQRGYKRSIEVP